MATNTASVPRWSRGLESTAAARQEHIDSGGQLLWRSYHSKKNPECNLGKRCEDVTLRRSASTLTDLDIGKSANGPIPAQSCSRNAGPVWTRPPHRGAHWRDNVRRFTLSQQTQRHRRATREHVKSARLSKASAIVHQRHPADAAIRSCKSTANLQMAGITSSDGREASCQ